MGQLRTLDHKCCYYINKDFFVSKMVCLLQRKSLYSLKPAKRLIYILYNSFVRHLFDIYFTLCQYCALNMCFNTNNLMKPKYTGCTQNSFTKYASGANTHRKTSQLETQKYQSKTILFLIHWNSSLTDILASYQKMQSGLPMFLLVSSALSRFLCKRE